MAFAKPTVNDVVRRLAGVMPAANSLWEFEDLLLHFLSREFPELSDPERRKLAADTSNFGILQKFMEEPLVEDIMINGLNHIFVCDSRKGMIESDVKFNSYDELDDFIKKLLLFSGKAELHRINDFYVPGGARANIIYSPFGPQITIRRFKQVPPSIIDLIDWGMLDFQIAAQLWLYVDGLGVKPANMLITGGPAAGKTTLLNAMFSFMPEGQRIVVCEDTLELNTKTEKNCSRLVSGDGVSLEDLVKNSLRMRPDRIVVGEVRGAEAMDMMTAMNVGRVCMGTLHAGSAREAILRLQSAPMSVPVQSIPLIDIIVSTGRFIQNGKMFRMITGISEISGIESGKVLLADRYSFDFKTRRLVETSPSVVYRDRLAFASGVQPKALMENIKVREAILRELKRQGITSLEAISSFCKAYHETPAEALKEYKFKV